MTGAGKSGAAGSGAGGERVVNTCPSCRRRLDVTHYEPFAKIACPICGESMRVRTHFDHFRIVRPIGEGGMSRVFLAEDVALGRKDALKILHRQFSVDPERTRQFEREAKITASISHPNVVKVYSVGRDQGYFYIAMELVGRGSMDELIRREGRVSEERGLAMGIDVAKGLRAAHKAGLIHRDVKPGNILFGNDGVPKIVDFGLALVYEQDVDESGEIWATPYYVPPEKLDHQAEDFRSDIYSLGASLFHGFAGRPPFAADTASIAELKKLKAKPIALREAAPEVSDATCAVVDRAMAFDPRERHHSYDELIDELQYALKCVRRGITGRSWVSRRETRRKRRAATIVVGAAALVGAVVLVTSLLRGGSGGEGSGLPGEAAGLLEDRGVVELAGGSVSERMVAARQAMADGDWESARPVLEALAESGEVVQPTRSWARFLAGVACLLGGERDPALAHFRRLAEAGPFSGSAGERELADFFVDMGRTVGTGDALPTGLLDGGRWSGGVEIAGLPAFGLLEWLRGDAATASRFLQAFLEADPTGCPDWLIAYRPLMQRYVSDAEALEALPDLPTTIEDPNELEGLREHWAGVVADLKTTTGPSNDARMRLAAFESVLEEERRKRIAMAEERRDDQRLLELAAVRGILDESRGEVGPREFAAVADELRRLPSTTDDGRTAARDLAHLYDLAEAFVVGLVGDLNQKRFTGELSAAVAGSPDGGEVIGATRQQIRLRNGAGESVLAIADMPRPVLIRVAEDILASVTDSSEYFARRERMVAFAVVTGFTAFAEPAARELAREFPPFREVWQRLGALEVLR